MGLRIQDRIAQSSFLYRALSGGGYWCRWDSTRHFHHGSAPSGGHGFAALWPNHGSPETSRARGSRRGNRERRERTAKPGLLADPQAQDRRSQETDSQEPFHPRRRGERYSLVWELLWRTQSGW